MRAVEVESDHQLRNGIVTEELRKGFMWDKELLRIAEVKVNKK
jgi:molecular chaperone GrpE